MGLMSVAAGIWVRLMKKSRMEKDVTVACAKGDWQDALARACSAEPVQVIGTKFVLYKRNQKEPKIVLVKEKKRP